MKMTLTDDQEMLADTVQRFLAETAPVAHLRTLRDAGNAEGFSCDVWQQFAEMGFLAVMIPEAYGGLGLGQSESGLILREIGRNLTPTPFLSTAVGAVSVLRNDQTGAAGEWLPRIATGEAVIALAVDEGSKHRGDACTMTASRQGNGYVLNGQKTFCLFGHVADLVMVMARDEDDDELTLFLVDPQANGLTLETVSTVDSGYASHLLFQDVQVERKLKGGAKNVLALMSAVRTGASAEMLGLSDGAVAMTNQYLSERQQFGVPIGSFQALQHRAAQLYCELEVSRAAVRKAEILLDEGGEDATNAVHVAKASAGWTSRLAVQEAVQLHGGIGMTDEHDIGLFMKRQRVLDELFGDSNYHAAQLAQRLGY